MTKTIEATVPGNKGLAMAVSRNNFTGPEEVFIRRTGGTEHSPNGIVYTPWEAYQFILAIAEMAGLKYDPTAAGTGIILQAPEDPKMGQRRDDIAMEYLTDHYHLLGSYNKAIVDRMVELEQKAGEL